MGVFVSLLINIIVKTNNIHTHLTSFCVLCIRSSNVRFAHETCMLFIETFHIHRHAPSISAYNIHVHVFDLVHDNCHVYTAFCASRIKLNIEKAFD